MSLLLQENIWPSLNLQNQDIILGVAQNIFRGAESTLLLVGPLKLQFQAHGAYNAAVSHRIVLRRSVFALWSSRHVRYNSLVSGWCCCCCCTSHCTSSGTSTPFTVFDLSWPSSSTVTVSSPFSITLPSISNSIQFVQQQTRSPWH